jgi:heme-degrading monooxygenase HmoA
MTVLTARVDPDRVEDLEGAFAAAAAELPEGIVESFLLRDSRSASSFQIVTLWRSRAALEAMRSSGVTPKGIQIFQSVGAAPDVAVLDVVAHAQS